MAKRDRPITQKFIKPRSKNAYVELGEEIKIKNDTFVVKKVSSTTITLHLKK